MLGRFVATFVAVFLAELPDKTMVATLVLTTTYRRAFWVWLGAAAAFLVHVTVAVIAGDLLARLPDRPVKAVVAVLFAVGAIVLWRQRGEPVDPDQEEKDLHLHASHLAGAHLRHRLHHAAAGRGGRPHPAHHRQPGRLDRPAGARCSSAACWRCGRWRPSPPPAAPPS